MANATFDRLAKYYTDVSGKQPKTTFAAIKEKLLTMFGKQGNEREIQVYMKQTLENSVASIAAGYTTAFWKEEERARTINWKVFIRKELGRDVAYENHPEWYGRMTGAAAAVSDPANPD